MICKKYTFIIWGSVVAIFLWLLESFLHVVVFKTGDFLESFFSRHDPDELWMRLVTTFVVMFASSIAQYMANKITKAYEKEREINIKLEASIKEIKLLQGILPICASCKKIRDDKGFWNQVETYITEHSEAQFSHGICPECAKKLYPEFTREHLKE